MNESGCINIECLRTLQRRGIPWYRKPLGLGIEHMQAPKIVLTSYFLYFLSVTTVTINCFWYKRFVEYDEPKGYARSVFRARREVFDEDRGFSEVLRNCTKPGGSRIEQELHVAASQQSSAVCPHYCRHDWQQWYEQHGCSELARSQNDGECKTATDGCDLMSQEQMNVFDNAGQVAFLPTRIKEMVYTRDCNPDNDTEDVCAVSGWKRQSKTVRFVAGVEHVDLYIEHSFYAARFHNDDPLSPHWKQSSFDMPGKLVRVNTQDGSRSTVKVFSHKGEVDGLEMGSESARTKLHTIKNDVIPLAELLRSANIDKLLDEKSDAPDAAGASMRYDGIVLVATIFYDDQLGVLVPPKLPATYEYTVSPLSGLEYKVFNTFWLEYPNELLIVHKTGVFIQILQSGTISRFSPLQLLLYIAAMMPIIKATRLITDMMALVVLHGYCGRRGASYNRFPPGERRHRAAQDFFRKDRKSPVAATEENGAELYHPIPGLGETAEVTDEGSLHARFDRLEQKVSDMHGICMRMQSSSLRCRSHPNTTLQEPPGSATVSPLAVAPLTQQLSPHSPANARMGQRPAGRHLPNSKSAPDLLPESPPASQLAHQLSSSLLSGDPARTTSSSSGSTNPDAPADFTLRASTSHFSGLSGGASQFGSGSAGRIASPHRCTASSGPALARPRTAGTTQSGSGRGRVAPPRQRHASGTPTASLRGAPLAAARDSSRSRREPPDAAASPLDAVRESSRAGHPAAGGAASPQRHSPQQRPPPAATPPASALSRQTSCQTSGTGLSQTQLREFVGEAGIGRRGRGDSVFRE